MVKLSERMQAIADLVTPGLSIADIGCDHGYLPIWLVKQGITPSAVAMDIGMGPLCAAREHIHTEGLDEIIRTRLSDGLTELKDGEGQSVIIAGMGGQLVLKIVTEGKKFWPQIQEFILQPQSELALFRRTMRELGFQCVMEDMVYEDGKYYPMGRYVLNIQRDLTYEELIHRVMDYDKATCLADEYGAYLLVKKHPVLYEYIKKERVQLFKIRDSLALMQDEEAKMIRMEEIEEGIKRNSLAESFFD